MLGGGVLDHVGLAAVLTVRVQNLRLAIDGALRSALWYVKSHPLEYI